MQPVLFELLETAFPSYFVLLLFGFLVATAGGVLWARRRAQNPDVIVDLGLSMLVFGVLGARLLHVLADGYFWDYVHLCTNPAAVSWPLSEGECLRVSEPDWLSALLGARPEPLGRWDTAHQTCHPIEQDCFAWARFWAGGLTYYGGFLGASAAAIWSLRRDKFPFWKAADMAGLVIPLGLACGRLGCWLGGCCFGLPWDGPWAAQFPPFSPASTAQARAGLLADRHLASLHVHPTQIYEALGCLLLGLLLVVAIEPRKRFDGTVFAAFVAGYAGLRFVLEFFRADDRGAALGLSTSQWIGIGLVGAALTLWQRKARQLAGPVVPSQA